MQLLHGDCLNLMKDIEDGSVDMILCDLPYGTTACKWDTIIPFEPLWKEYERIIKQNGAIVLFGQEPFSSHLRLSNSKIYKYDWIWHKSNPSNIALANKQPMRYHETISVFYKKQPTYNKQMIPRHNRSVAKQQKSGKPFVNRSSEQTGLKEISVDPKKYDKDWKNPSTILQFPSLRPTSKEFVKHPTQKPVALLKYLIKTYTNENETVLDNTMGSGSTGVACVETNRNFIGMEMDQDFFSIGYETYYGTSMATNIVLGKIMKVMKEIKDKINKVLPFDIALELCQTLNRYTDDCKEEEVFGYALYGKIDDNTGIVVDTNYDIDENEWDMIMCNAMYLMKEDEIGLKVKIHKEEKK